MIAEPSETRCPAAELLEDFVFGRLDEWQIDEISDHVAQCEGCCWRVEAVESRSDGFISMLRQQVPLLLVSPSSAELSDTRHAAADTDSDALLPAHFGRYRVTGLLGRGGFATVYAGVDEKLGRAVAIKVPRHDKAFTKRTAEAFLHEAKTLALLDHPRIIPVYDVGQFSGGYFVVSKFVPGQSLSRYLRKRSTIELSECLVIATEAAEALHYAHEQGWVHRDVKPGNILLDHERTVYIGDFGLAAPEIRIQLDSPHAGTPAYMSPEQIRGEGHRIDRRSDVYSLGVVLYELLTGQRPFDDRELDCLLQRITDEDPRLPSELNAAIPQELERICLKAMAKRASDRYESARAMALELRAAASLVALESGSGSEALETASPQDTPAARELNRFEPPGLHPFRAAHHASFLNLVPGPRDRHGFPERLAAIRRLLDKPAGDVSVPVGLLCGPSGSGKSSLVQAGLLPNLPPGLQVVYLDAADAGLIRSLDSALRGLAQPATGNDLRERCQSIRTNEAHADTKILVVIDQFEHLFHRHDKSTTYALIEAFRQFDGTRLQALVIAREDYLSDLTAFFRSIEIRLVEGVNFFCLEPFDRTHAERVLVQLGWACGRVEHPRLLSNEQRCFIRQIVAELAEGDRVAPVRLAFFAETARHGDWHPDTLAIHGGTIGMGVAFLDDMFYRGRAAERASQLETSARQVLKALLTDGRPGLLGESQSHADLQRLAGLDDASFGELMSILTEKLKFVTAIVAFERQNGIHPADSAVSYRLAHDFLVPIVRGWIELGLKATRQGRATLLLQDRTSWWLARPEQRMLPNLLEYASILRWTSRRTWSDNQKRMMRSATRRVLFRAAAVLVCLLALLAGGHLVRERLVHGRYEQLVVAYLHSRPREADRYLRRLQDRPWLSRGLLAPHLNRTGPESLRAACGLGALGADLVKILVEQVATAPGHECPNLVAGLKAHRQSAVARLTQQLEHASSLGHHARVALMLSYLGEPRALESALAAGPDPSLRTACIHEARDWLGDLAELCEQIRTTPHADVRSALCSILGLLNQQDLGHDDLRLVERTLQRAWHLPQEPGTHSAADWALRRLRLRVPHTQRISRPDQSAWHVNRSGMTMVRIAPGTFRMGYARYPESAALNDWSEIPHWVTLRRPYWISTTEVTVGQFAEFLSDIGREQAQSPLTWSSREPLGQDDQGRYYVHDPKVSPTTEHPVSRVSWSDAVLFCNWLSRREGLQPCYLRDSGGQWVCDFDGDGYRLPTDAEWEYACRAGSDTWFFFGNDLELIPHYAVVAQLSSAPTAATMPNPWGLFDTHGNVVEWCWDAYAPVNTLPEVDPSGARGSGARIHRGGSWYYKDAFWSFSATRRWHDDPSYRDANIGLRVARNQPRQHGIFQENGGVLCIETDHFDAHASAGQLAWQTLPLATATHGFVVQSISRSGGHLRHVASEDAASDSETSLTYTVQLHTPGRYRVWLKGTSFDNSRRSASIHLGNQHVEVTLPREGQQWCATSEEMVIERAGTYTLVLRTRSPQLVVDRIIAAQHELTAASLETTAESLALPSQRLAPDRTRIPAAAPIVDVDAPARRREYAAVLVKAARASLPTIHSSDEIRDALLSAESFRTDLRNSLPLVPEDLIRTARPGMGLGSSGQVCASNTHLSTRRGDALIWRLPRIASAADTRLTLTADLYLAWEGDASGNQFDIELGQHPPLAVSFASQPSIQRWSNGEMEALFLPTYAPARAHMSGILLLSVPRAYLEPEGQRLVLDAVKSAVVMRVAVLPSIYTVDVLRSYLRGK